MSTIEPLSNLTNRPYDDQPVELSVAVPVYNEEQVLREFYERVKPVCDSLNHSYELVFVDDGSRDATYSILQEIKKGDSTVKIIRLTRNFGQQAAILAAFRHSRGKIILQIDADLQNPPEEIPKLLDAFTDEVDLVTTIPIRRQDSMLRTLGSQMLRWLGERVSGNSFQLNLSSFRAMRRSVIEKIETCSDRSRYLAVLMSWMAVPSKEIEVEHHNRPKGKTKYAFFNLVKLSWDLVTGFSNLPLRLVTYMGFLGSVIGFLLMLFLLYQRVVKGILVEGFVVLSAVFAFFAGVQLFSVGILGEYLGRIYMQVQNRPDYIIEKVIE